VQWGLSYYCTLAALLQRHFQSNLPKHIERAKMLSTAMLTTSHDATTAGCHADNQSSKKFKGPAHGTQAEADQDVGLDAVV